MTRFARLFASLCTAYLLLAVGASAAPPAGSRDQSAAATAAPEPADQAAPPGEAGSGLPGLGLPDGGPGPGPMGGPMMGGPMGPGQGPMMQDGGGSMSNGRWPGRGMGMGGLGMGGMGTGQMQGMVMGPGYMHVIQMHGFTCTNSLWNDVDRTMTGDEARVALTKRLSRIGNDRLKVGKVEEKDAGTIQAEIVTVDNSLVQRFEIDRKTGRFRRVP